MVCSMSNTHKVRWWLCGRVPDLQSGGCRFKSRPGLLRTKVYSACHPSGVGEWIPAVAGKAKAGMAHSDCGWTCGCAGKTVRSLENMCHTWALLRWCFTMKRRYIKCTYLYLYKRSHYSNPQCAPVGVLQCCISWSAPTETMAVCKKWLLLQLTFHCYSTSAATDKLIKQAECHRDWPLYDDVFHPPPLRLESRKPLWWDLQTIDATSQWREDWQSVVNSTLVVDPTIRPPGFDLHQRQWSLLNRFRTGQITALTLWIRFCSLGCHDQLELQTL